MARRAATSQPRKQATRKRDASKKQNDTRKSGQSATNESRIIDARHRRDIAGVVFILLAVVLMLVVVLPVTTETGAVVTNAAGEALKLVFGVGCYILPFFLAAVGVTFLVRFEQERVPARVVVGLAVIFVALLGFISLFTPVTNVGGDNLSLLFANQALLSYGGYVGAAIAWVGLTLFGQVISWVILAGLMLVGVIIIGFSISKLIETLRAKHAERAMYARENPQREKENDSGTPLFARIRRNNDNDDDYQQEMLPYDAQTNVLINPIAPPLSEATATQIRRDNKRHRSDRDLTESIKATSAFTQVIDPIDAPVSTEDEPYFDDYAEGVDAADTIVISDKAMTRKLGKKSTESTDARKTNDSDTLPTQKIDKPQEGSLNARTTATPHPQEGFILPSMSLLRKPRKNTGGKTNSTELEETANQLQSTLEEFGIMATVVDGIEGPTVTLFMVELPPGVRVSRVTALNDDIALALAAPGVRIFSPVPGTNYVGIEVPNHTRRNVLLSEVLADADSGPLQIAIGKDVEGHSIVSDLAQMPHLLIGGTTGSGKSVAINAMIMSILMRATPAEVRFILIDPKRVEFTPYNGIPHLYVPVVTEAREAASALSWGVAEMERRLKVFSKAGARNIGQFNAKVQQAHAEEQAAREAGEEVQSWPYDDELPYIVIIIDELSDLMMSVGKEVEFSISRIAQLARAAGIHLIVATQRPSTNVVTGLIKANITNRIAFNVASGIDSRVILDTPGAENLIGLGDLLFVRPELAKPQRIQGCFVSEEEINAVVAQLKEQGEPEYHSEILSTNLITVGSTGTESVTGRNDDDPLIWEAAEIVVSSGFGSTSNIQRRLKVGYSRAGRIMDQLEEKGIVGPANGSKPREVLVDAMDLETLKAFEENDADEASSFTEE